jgi:hypothetical protein
MLRLLLVLVVLSLFGGYRGYVSPNYGYGDGGAGLIVLLVLLFRQTRIDVPRTQAWRKSS